MNSKRVVGIIIAVIGVVLFVFANYIQGEVSEGRGRISAAQKQVNQGKSLFSLNPVTKEVGKGFFGSAQKQINEGRDEADRYERLSGQLQIGGIIVFVVGIAILVFGGKRSKRSR